jgi:hypothetical protein
MRRVLIALITALPLAVGVASAQADQWGPPGFPGDGGTQQAAVAGTVVGPGTTPGSFVANAYVVTGGDQGDDPGDQGDDPGDQGDGPGDQGGGSGFPAFGGGFGGWGGWGGAGGFGDNMRIHTAWMTGPTTPTTTQVTITTNSSTVIKVFGAVPGGMMGGESDSWGGDTNGTVSQLTPGAKFIAFFNASPTDTIQNITANPATAVYAHVPPQFYAFVGTVTAVTQATSTTPGSVTVTTIASLPNGLFTGSAMFTVDDHTFVIGGNNSSSGGGFFGGLFGGSLSNVSTGDTVAGGVIGAAGMTAAQVEATPLMFLLDLPGVSSGTGTTGSGSTSMTKALGLIDKLLKGGHVKLGHKHHHHKSRSSHHSAR